MEAERKNVRYKGLLSKYGNCLCNGCHSCGFVTKVTYPETLFFNGQDLTTKYAEWWLCENCKKKLIEALQTENKEE